MFYNINPKGFKFNVRNYIMYRCMSLWQKLVVLQDRWSLAAVQDWFHCNGACTARVQCTYTEIYLKFYRSNVALSSTTTSTRTHGSYSKAA